MILNRRKTVLGSSLAYCITQDGKLTGDIVIPEGWTTHAASLTNNNSNMTSVVFPTTYTMLPSAACVNSENLESVTFKAPVTDVPMQAFYQCTGMTHLDIDWTQIKAIGSGGFYMALLIANFPNGIDVRLDNAVSIADNGLSGCTAIRTLHLGNKLTNCAAAFSANTHTLTVEEGFDCNLPVGGMRASDTDWAGIIANYKDNSSTGITRTLTLPAADYAALSEETLAAAKAKGLTVASA